MARVHRTKTGRVVYNRKPHLFKPKDAARILRDAIESNLKYLVITYKSPYFLNQIAWLEVQRFMDFGADWNFIPRDLVEAEPGELTPVQQYAMDMAWRVASIMGVPDWVEYLTDMFVSEFAYGQYSANFTISPRLASIITESLRRPRKSEEEIYGSLFK